MKAVTPPQRGDINAVLPIREHLEHGPAAVDVPRAATRRRGWLGSSKVQSIGALARRRCAGLRRVRAYESASVSA